MAKYKIISYDKNLEYTIEADNYHIQDKLMHFNTETFETIATFSVIDFYVIREDMSNRDVCVKDPNFIETEKSTWVSYADTILFTIEDLERIEKGESYEKVLIERITDNCLNGIESSLKKYYELLSEKIISKYKK